MVALSHSSLAPGAARLTGGATFGRAPTRTRLSRPRADIGEETRTARRNAARGGAVTGLACTVLALLTGALLIAAPILTGALAGSGGPGSVPAAAVSPAHGQASGRMQVQVVAEGADGRESEVPGRLDPDALKAELNWIASRTITLAVRRARLDAEMRGDESLTLPPDLEARRDEPRVAAGIRRQGLQHRHDADALRAQLAARRADGTRIAAALAEIDHRIPHDPLVRPPHLALERALAAIKSETLRLAAAVASAEIAAAETNQRLADVRSEIAARAASALAPVQGELIRLARRRAVAERQLAATAELTPRRAPVQAGAFRPAATAMALSQALRLSGWAHEDPSAPLPGAPAAGSALGGRAGTPPHDVGRPILRNVAEALVRVADEPRLGDPAGATF